MHQADKSKEIHGDFENNYDWNSVISERLYVQAHNANAKAKKILVCKNEKYCKFYIAVQLWAFYRKPMVALA